MNNNSIRVLVTDGDHARILERANHVTHLQCVKELSNTHESKFEHSDDQPGRVFESARPGSHAYESQTNWTDYRKELFIQEIASEFVGDQAIHNFPKVCLICPSKLMTHLRSNLQSHFKSLHESKRPQIIEIAKNLTNQSINEIEEILIKEMV